LLNDSARDWYADLLLYNLTGMSTMNIVGCDTRIDWIGIKRSAGISYKEVDVEIWRKYLSNISPSSKY
jgi:hypothetical protein